MSTVRSINPTVDRALLPSAEFVDAFETMTPSPISARQAAERMLARAPRWVDALMALRNVMVAPFGLNRPAVSHRSTSDRIGIFPVIRESSERVVAGFDDHHLDFRVVVDVMPAGTGARVTASTLVRTHNRLGRVYLATILPFHRLVVRALLRQVGG